MSNDLYDNGMAIRRAVLSDEHVDRAMNSATPFNRPFQDLVTEYCWGKIWTRETLSRKTRSLITLAILTSLRADTELKGHVRGALRNGCTEEEIQEVLLHATIYCGVPAGMEAFRAAKEVIDAQ